MGDSDDVQSYSQSFLLLHQQSSSFHHQQRQIRQNNEQRSILRNNTNSFQKPTGLRGKIRKGKIHLRLRIVMRDNAPIDIVFQLDSDIIFRIPSFQVAQIGNPMKQGEVVYDGVKIKMVILCKAGDIEISNPDGGVAAEHEYRLRFVRILREVADDVTC